MNDNDIKKCKKNGYVWVSDDKAPYQIRRDSGGTRWKAALRQIHKPCMHPTRAAAQAAIDERKRLARVDEYYKSMDPVTNEQVKDLRKGNRIWFVSRDHKHESPFYFVIGEGFDVDAKDVEASYFSPEAAQAAINKRLEQQRLARLAEYRKTQMTPITPEQAKMLREGDEFFYLQHGGGAPKYHVTFDKLKRSPDITKWKCFVNGLAYFTHEAAESALAKQKPCDMPDEMCLDGVKCRRLADNEQRKAGDIPVDGSQTHRFGSVWYRPVEFHETPVGETQHKEVVTDETQAPKPTTVRGWLETIPDPAIRASAIRQCSDWNRNCTGLAKAIVEIWSWFVTEEGPRFWFRCYNAANGADTWPAYPPKAKQEADGWTQEEIDKAAFKPKEWTDILQHVVSRDPSSKYHRTIHGVSEGTATVDVYNVLEAFGVTCPACQHAIKKLLCPGLRGKGSRLQDLTEAAASIARAIELEKQRGKGKENERKA